MASVSSQSDGVSWRGNREIRFVKIHIPECMDLSVKLAEQLQRAIDALTLDKPLGRCEPFGVLSLIHI